MSDFSKPAKEFADLPIVQTHLRAASEFIGRNAALKFLESTDGCMRHVTSLKFDSPLELLFWLWWSACERGSQFFHAFHERTPEQVAKRDSRDRNLQQAGWTVFHYSWAEFTKEPELCVTEVYDLATTTAVELYRQYVHEVPVHLRGDD